MLGALKTFIFVAGCCLIAAQSSAKTPMQLAQDASTELSAAARALKSAQKSSDRVIALSKTVKAYENGLLAVRESLRAAAIREQVVRLQLAAKRDQISRLLGVLQTMERAPTPLLMIHPAGAIGTARSGMIMSEVTPTLQIKATDLRGQLDELVGLRKLQKDAEGALQEGLMGAQSARIALSTAISERTDLPIRFASDPIKVQIMADNSKTLNFFANGLSDIPIEGIEDVRKTFLENKGRIPLPIQGALLRGFNETDAAGIKRPGVVITARPLSLITAPTPATIRFAGSFLDYGKVIILEPEPGFLIVIAGLDQIYGEFGQIVNSGDPIGLLGGNQPQTQDFLIEASEGGGTIGQESLYIEIRKDGEPVDPTDWFALSNI